MRLEKKNGGWQRLIDLGTMSTYLARMDREGLKEDDKMMKLDPRV